MTRLGCFSWGKHFLCKLRDENTREMDVNSHGVVSAKLRIVEASEGKNAPF